MGVKNGCRILKPTTTIGHVWLDFVALRPRMAVTASGWRPGGYTNRAAAQPSLNVAFINGSERLWLNSQSVPTRV